MAYDRLREGKVRMGEKEWQTIYANTDACFPGFTGRLRTTFPFLKEDDIRLCCLVKMEMPLDLTALIFGIGKGSVNLAGLPLLADARGPVGSPCSDSPRAMITETTRRCLCLVYGFSSRAALEAAVAEAAEAFASLSGASDMRSWIVE